MSPAEVTREVTIVLRPKRDPKAEGEFAWFRDRVQELGDLSTAEGGATVALTANTASAKESLKDLGTSYGTTAKAAEDSAKKQEQAAKKLSDQAVITNARVAEENKKLAESFKGVLDGTLMLGQGIAMMGLAGEEDIEKLLRSLVKVQATFNVMKGSVDITIKLWESMKAYRAGIEAARTARIALTVAETAGTAAATSATVATTSLATAEVTATAATVGLTTALGPLVLGGAAIAAALAGIAMLIPGVREGFLEWIGWTNKAADAEERLKRAVDRRRLALESAAAYRLIDIELGFTTPEQALAESTKRAEEARATLRAAPTERMRRVETGREELRMTPRGLEAKPVFETITEQIGPPPGLVDAMEQADKEHLQALRRMRQFKLEELNTEKTRATVALQARQKELDLAKSTRDQAQQQIDILKESLLSAEERFGLLDPAEQERIFRALEQAKERGAASLSLGQLGAVQRVGLQGTAAIVREGARSKFDVERFQGLVGAEERAQQEGLRGTRDRADASIVANLAKGFREELGNFADKVVKVSVDKIEHQVTINMEGVTRDIEEAIRQEMEAWTHDLRESMRANADMRAHRKATGGQP